MIFGAYSGPFVRTKRRTLRAVRTIWRSTTSRFTSKENMGQNMLAHRIVTCLAELPDLTRSPKLYLDYETDSGSTAPGGAESEPWRHARIAAVGVSDGIHVWTVTTDRMLRGPNRLPADNVIRWIADQVRAQHTRYVAQFIRVESHLSRAEGFPFNRGAMHYCTEIAAHHFADNLEEFNLEYLCEKLLGYTDQQRWKSRIMDFFRDCKLNRGQQPGNYAEIPTEILHPYMFCDVEGCVLLEQFMDLNFLAEQREALEQDFEAGMVLSDMNYEGIRIDKRRLLVGKFMHLKRKIELGERLSKNLGYEINPLSSDQIGDLLLNHHKLPVLRWNYTSSGKDDGEERSAHTATPAAMTNQVVKTTPSFDDDTLDLYLLRPDVQQKTGLVEVITDIAEYKTVQKRLGFVEAYLKQDEFAGQNGAFGRLHGDIHPCRAKGGRTTAARPNLQQCDSDAKLYLVPEDGDGFLDVDASQIEYRMMAHIMRDDGLIRGYTTSRVFDIHAYVQEWLHLKRREAKVINFGTAFNMGKVKLARELSHMTGGAISVEQAEQILEQYFSMVPTLKPTRRQAESLAKQRGWVKNFFGRRSHLTSRNAYKAFNRWVQGTAADVVKNRMVAVDKALRAAGLREYVKPKLLVHDELIWSVRHDLEICREALPLIIRTLEGFDRMRVPIWWEGAYTLPGSSWYDVAKLKDDKNLPALDAWGVPIKAPPQLLQIGGAE